MTQKSNSADAEKARQVEEMWQAYETCAKKIAHGKAEWGPGWSGLWGRPA
jgi:hypothetical protein